MQTGIIKWFNHRRGFVLIEPDNGSADVLLHVTAIEGATSEELIVGQRVQFETIETSVDVLHGSPVIDWKSRRKFIN